MRTTWHKFQKNRSECLKKIWGVSPGKESDSWRAVETGRFISELTNSGAIRNCFRDFRDLWQWKPRVQRRVLPFPGWSSSWSGTPVKRSPHPVNLDPDHVHLKSKSTSKQSILSKKTSFFIFEKSFYFSRILLQIWWKVLRKYSTSENFRLESKSDIIKWQVMVRKVRLSGWFSSHIISTVEKK